MEMASSGCQWNRLPKELGDDSTIIATFQRWVGTGVLHRMWGALVEGCELDGVDWEWQAGNGAMACKARFGGTKDPNRGKAGTKAQSPCGWRGRPLEHCELREQTCTMPSCAERPQPTEEEPQHLCLDKGYDNPSGRSDASASEKLDASMRQAVSGAPVGCGTDAGIALQVPCGPGPVRQEAQRTTSVIDGHFEIVAKPESTEGVASG